MTEEEEYEVEDIVGETKIPGKDITLYRVRWKGFGEENDTFEPIENLGGCSEILFKYFDRKKLEEEKQSEKKSKSKSKSREKKKKDTKESKERHQSKSNMLDNISKASRYFSDESSNSPPPPPPTDFSISKEKKKKKEKEKVKPSKSTPKRKYPQPIKIIVKSDDESGNIFSDFSSNSSQTEEPKKDIIRTPSFITNNADEKIKEVSVIKTEKEKSKKKDEKPTETINKKEKSKKSTKKEEKNSPKIDSPKTKKKVSSKSDKKTSKKSESSEKSKSDSKKRLSNKSSKSEKNSLPFDLFISDGNNEENNSQTKHNISAIYGEEHHLVLNPLPILSLKRKIEENGIVFIECQIPDRIETEKIPISLIKILQPKMLESFEANNS
ncbi:M-phase phosphoprotein 8 [Tritrichomonas musculus]|uniref:M-phase phosphoprotein 8 n=1 Tax=Tritrichomonas musculus TaxID=1915356 RepID=A0ABR2KC01_9EUKA